MYREKTSVDQEDAVVDFFSQGYFTFMYWSSNTECLYLVLSSQQIIIFPPHILFCLIFSLLELLLLLLENHGLVVVSRKYNISTESSSPNWQRIS